ncbi:MAG: hypothetical protein HYV38_00885 [Candidatus Levybacteria bacterium]|nr:hypothetical protein [Candidatus Levybacteria bacterium]
MPDSNLAFAKIVSNPSASSWSQAYNAGKLFAVLSLQKTTDNENEGDGLSTKGKEILSSLEQEFFTLETKDLNSIKQALSVTIQQIPPDLRPSFVICYIAGSVLYIFIYGKGKVTLRRGSKIGEVLEGSEEASIKSASGFLQNEDIIVLQTGQFSQIIPRSTLVSSLDHQTPEQIAETLAPHIHEREEGGASAIILGFSENGAITSEDIEDTIEPTPLRSETQEEQPEISLEEKVETESDKNKEKTEEKFDESVFTTPEEPEEKKDERISFEGKGPEDFLSSPAKKPPSARFSSIFLSVKQILGRFKPNNLNKSRRLYLTIGAIILVVLLAGILFSVMGRSGTDKKLFDQVYNEASIKYEEGKSLSDLNAASARDSFLASRQIIEQNLDKFPSGSEERSKLSSLLANVEESLSGSEEKNQVNPAEVESSESDLLSARIDNKAEYFAQNDENVYFLTDSGITSISKSDKDKEEIIENDDDWEKVGGLGAYLGNVYVLDKSSDKVIKFVAAESGFGQANYFASGTKSDLSSAVAIGIDGALYILFSDGRIEKYNKGTKETFSISGLSKELSSPTRIFASTDIDEIYILDNGNSRIVALNKDGSYKTEYSSPLLKPAEDFEVSSDGKKIYFLSGNKVYTFSLF